MTDKETHEPDFQGATATPKPPADPPATPETPPELPADPTTRELKTHLEALESKLDQLLAMGASSKETEAIADQIVETEAILETPAATGEDLDPATTDPGQPSDPARNGDPTANSSPEGAEPETPKSRRRRKGLGRRSRA